jgi:hypothetical protein
MTKKKKKVAGGAGDAVSVYVDHLRVLNDSSSTSVAQAIALLGRIAEELETPAWQQSLRSECARWHEFLPVLTALPAPSSADGVQTAALRALRYLSEAASSIEAFLDDLRTERLDTPGYDDTRLDAAIAKIDVALMLMEDVEQQAQRLLQSAKTQEERVSRKRLKKQGR